jgi:CCR4-NOT transcription complex subunit 1
MGGVTAQQMTVYEEFARNIPGFLPLSERETQTLFVPKAIAEPPAIQPFAANAPAAAAMAVATAQQVAYAAAVSNDEVGTMLEKLGGEVRPYNTYNDRN